MTFLQWFKTSNWNTGTARQKSQNINDHQPTWFAAQDEIREKIAREIIPDHRGRCVTDEAAKALAEDIRRIPIE